MKMKEKNEVLAKKENIRVY